MEGKKTLRSMRIPIIISSNVRLVMCKMNDIESEIRGREYSKLGVIMLRETWLHEDVDDKVVAIERSTCNRFDLSITYKSRSGGVIKYVNAVWCMSKKRWFCFLRHVLN
ncbi:unnamed protein product, partial [Dicrocoelium dendriticum]